MTNWIQPGSTIGIIGGGSVARFLAISAKKLGYKIGIIDPDSNCLAATVADWHFKAELNNDTALMDLAMKSNVVIYESELVHYDNIKKMIRTVPVPQGEEVLTIAQDRMLQKAFLESVRVNIAPYATIVSISDIEEAIQGIGFPCVLKANATDERLKEHLIMYEEKDIVNAERLLSHGTCVLEAWIPLDKELCIGILKEKSENITLFPVNEIKYSGNQLIQAIVPARISNDMRMEVERIGTTISEGLNFTGVIAVELFTTESGALYVNEIVAHPHHSNHYTGDFSNLSQYDAHIKAVTGWPILDRTSSAGSLVMQIIKKGQEEAAYTQAQMRPEWVFKFYENNSSELNEDIGHVSIKTDDVQKTLISLKEIFG